MNATRLRFLTAGESHGPSLTAILDGMPAGLRLSVDDIDRDLRRRRGVEAGRDEPYVGASARMRMEGDTAEITGGVMAGITTGAPIAVHIVNADHAKWKGKATDPITVPRPGHADLTGALKYGFDDLRLSLERASARETAARVAIGAACRRLLGEFGIRVGSAVVEIGGVGSNTSHMQPHERIAAADRTPLRCPDVEATVAMEERIREIAREKQSAGGVFEVIAIGAPAGLGSYSSWDRRLSARLCAAAISVPAITGVEIGDGFERARIPSTSVHDAPRVGADGRTIERRSNRAGGLEGGISNGEPIILRAAMKPLATMVAPQPSVDLRNGAEASTAYQRSDICAVPRAAVVAEAMVCFVLADALLEKLGGDSMAEMRPRFDVLRKMRLDDFEMRNDATVYWP